MTDPDACLYRKSNGQETHLRYLVHHVTGVHSGVILSTQASITSGTAERETSLQQLAEIYDTTAYLQALFEQGIVAWSRFAI